MPIFNLEENIFDFVCIDLWLVDESPMEKNFATTISNTLSSLIHIRPGRSRLLEFERKYRSFNRNFFQISRPGRLIEPKNWPWQP